MKNESKKFLDTNILVYAEDSEIQRKHEIARDIIKKLIMEKTGFISIQVLGEFSNVLLTKSTKNVNASKINSIIFDYAETFFLMTHDIKTVQEANRISEQYKLHFYDALIVATLKENEIKTIITENSKDFKKIPWLEVVNPFKI